MHMNEPMTSVFWIVVPSRSRWKMRTTDIFGSTTGCPERRICFSRSWRSSQTGLSLTRARIHSVKRAGTIAIQNIARHAMSGLPLNSG
jgi:hypothetical protein